MSALWANVWFLSEFTETWEENGKSYEKFSSIHTPYPKEDPFWELSKVSPEKVDPSVSCKAREVSLS